MSDGRIEVRELTKRFGSVTAVDRLSFTVEPGRVTGFLGPNGAGKTTTLRVLLGLVRATAGTATIGGRHYDELERPQRTVGALLEASSFHPGRSGRDHLRLMAETAGLPARRADEVLDVVGLTAHGTRRAGGYSLGMRQRLGLAAALIGDPSVLVLDEPANGLDPEGIRWLRGFLRGLAAEGRTIVVSSHVLSEVEQTVDDVVIISRGRLVQASPLSALEEAAGRTVYVVAGGDPAPLRAALEQRGLGAEPGPREGAFVVQGSTPADVGRLAFAAGVELHELRRADGSLEDTFLRLVNGDQGQEVAA
ncbi:MAG TPA: ABC transporter ATP-binding protein [Pseudonocardiaceae bacterium]